MKIAAISIGDVNGIGPEIALKAHEKIKKFCQPVYFAHKNLLENAAQILKIDVSDDMKFHEINCALPKISPGKIAPDTGFYAYKSFETATKFAADPKNSAFLCTLPIHKKAWALANIKHIGHTEALDEIFGAHGVMMLGCEELFVALFTHHIPLKNVAQAINERDFCDFLQKLYENLPQILKNSKIPVLGLNPHAGDFGLIGDEDFAISRAIKTANKNFGAEIFFGPVPPDTAFSPQMRQKYRVFACCYHDQGLAPLKALHFFDSVNVTLGLPIVRTSVDHGVGFDIAYGAGTVSLKSYENAVTFGKILLEQRDV